MSALVPMLLEEVVGHSDELELLQIVMGNHKFI